MLLQRLKAVQWAVEQPGDLVRNLQWRMCPGRSDRRMVFIFGPPRSGTTLLQLMLAAHPKVFSAADEIGIFMTGQNLFRRERFTKLLPLDVLEEIYCRSSNISGFTNAVYDYLTNGNRGLLCVEKAPPHWHQGWYLSKIFPNARFIALLRDGRDCLCSARDHPWVRVTKAGSTRDFAAFWSAYTRRVLRLSRNRRAMFMSYEALVTEPRKNLQGLMRFLDEEVHESQLTTGATKDDPRARLAHFSKLREPPNSGSVGRWRKELSAQQIEIFHRIAGTELRAAGYAL